MLKYIRKYLTKSTKTAHAEQSTEQTDTKNQTKDDSSNRTFINDPIINTPFRMIGDEQNGYAAAFGNYRITESQKTPQDVVKYLETDYYTVIANMLVTMPMILKDNQERLATDAQNATN